MAPDGDDPGVTGADRRVSTGASPLTFMRSGGGEDDGVVAIALPPATCASASFRVRSRDAGGNGIVATAVPLRFVLPQFGVAGGAGIAFVAHAPGLGGRRWSGLCTPLGAETAPPAARRQASSLGSSHSCTNM